MSILTYRINDRNINCNTEKCYWLPAPQVQGQSDRQEQAGYTVYSVSMGGFLELLAAMTDKKSLRAGVGAIVEGCEKFLEVCTPEDVRNTDVRNTKEFLEQIIAEPAGSSR